MEQEPEIIVERIGAVARFVMNRPEQLNAFTPQMAEDIPRLMDEEIEAGARAIILTGAGRAFSSGAALGVKGQGTIADQMDHLYNPLALALSDLPVPIVTQVNGIAAGAGASLAFAGDIIVAARSSQFVLSFAKIGLVPDLGAAWLVARSAGRVKALQMALLAEKMSAQDALDCNLVTEVVDDEGLEARALEVAEKLASMPTRTLALIRGQVRSALEASFAESLAVETKNQVLATQTKDFAEGVAAFKERRKPSFTGE